MIRRTDMRFENANSLMSCLLTVGAFVAAAGGCNKGPELRPGWAIVSGTVMYQGKPLPAGEVIWCSEKDGVSIMRGGPIREDGTFTLDAPIGRAHIAIHNADVKNVRPESYVQIPARYTDPEKSGLTHELTAGENKDVKFNLQ
jgi:hypothetical protein